MAEPKARPGNDLSIIGSASLVRSLHAEGLIDHYTLLVHPLSLGSGTRLFDGPAPLTEFELTGSVTTTKGVIIVQYTRGDGGSVPQYLLATYQPDGGVSDTVTRPRRDPHARNRIDHRAAAAAASAIVRIGCRFRRWRV